jgi:hypothetical protein
MAEGNSGRGEPQPDILEFLQAQKQFAEILKSHSERLEQYFWRLTEGRIQTVSAWCLESKRRT